MQYDTNIFNFTALKCMFIIVVSIETVDDFFFLGNVS